MRKVLLVSSVALSSLLLAGCSAFYPNWGATSLPEEPAPIVETSETLAPTDTSEPTAEPEATASEEPTETAEPEIVRIEAEVTILIADAFLDTGMLEVVAQVPGVTESDGSCILRFIGGETEKTVSVEAQPSSDYTQCFPIEFPLADLPSGSGIVTVQYESDHHFGVSKPSSVVIP